MSFDFDFGSEVSPQWQTTFQRAADIWSSTLSGGSTGAPVALRYKIDTGQLGANAGGRPVLGGSIYGYGDVAYTDFRSALAANPNKSVLDVTALAWSRRSSRS